MTLFHAVEGAPPFHRDTKTGILTAILLKPQPPMMRANGGLRTLIAALTMKDPGDRPNVDEAVELLTGTRGTWRPLTTAETVDGDEVRPVSMGVRPNAGGKLPWQTQPA